MPLDLTIAQLVEDNLPVGFSVSTDYIDHRLKVAQLFLHEAAELTEADMYDIDNWSDKWKVLLAYLIVYDIYLRIMSGNVLFGSVSSDTGQDSSTTVLSVKKIVTGPTEVEYHNDRTSFSALLKTFVGQGGLMEILMTTACGYASSLGVKLPFCRARKTGTKILIAKSRKKSKYYNVYPEKKWPL